MSSKSNATARGSRSVRSVFSFTRRYRITYATVMTVIMGLLGACATPNLPIEPGSRFAVAKAGEAVELIGVLAVVDEKRCRLADGCGPKYRIFNENFDDRVPLLGEIDDTLGDQLIRVRGAWTLMEQDENNTGTASEGADAAVQVSNYEVLSGIKYRDFLNQRMDSHTLARFGCVSMWDKSFKWRTSGDDLWLVVGINKVDENESDGNRPFLELWYDARTENLKEERKSDPSVNPCAA